MKHIIVGNRHEYWEAGIYQKHLAEPFCNRWKPYYICYAY